jgi:dihydrofolate reductase
MGRGTYDWFLARGWASRPGAWADRLRALPKYVVTSTPLDNPAWPNTTALTGDPAEEATKLAHQLPGDIVVYGSGHLTRTLLKNGLVDEFRLMTYPVVVGAGRHLFGDTTRLHTLRLLSTRPIGTSLTFSTYQPG